MAALGTDIDTHVLHYNTVAMEPCAAPDGQTEFRREQEFWPLILGEVDFGPAITHINIGTWVGVSVTSSVSQLELEGCGKLLIPSLCG